MDASKYFDSEAYFRGLCQSNKLARENGFAFCTCTGIEGLEGPLSMMRKERAFFCLDDLNDGAMVRGQGGGFFKKRTFTVFLMHRYKAGDFADRDAKLGIVRELFRQVLAKMVIDERDLRKDMMLMQTERVMCSEFGHQFMPDVTGLYFMVEVAEPVDLTYDASLWQTD